MNALIKGIETESAYRSMRLNKDKCLTITMNGDAHTQFLDATKLKNEPDAKYLGITIDERASNTPDLN